MAFNVKSRLADALCEAVFAHGPSDRSGVTGFWVASLQRVQNERLLRIASLLGHHYLLEAEIDAQNSHVMVPERFDEYLEHEFLKHSKTTVALPVEKARNTVQACIAKGRIVVAFRNARPYSAQLEATARNPVWYTED